MSEKSIPTEKLSLLLTAQDASFIYGEPRNGPLHIGSLSFFKDQIPNPEAVGSDRQPRRGWLGLICWTRKTAHEATRARRRRGWIQAQVA